MTAMDIRRTFLPRAAPGFEVRYDFGYGGMRRLAGI